MKIPLTDLNAQYKTIQPEVDAAIAEVLKESGFILGKQVEVFEKQIAQYHNVKAAVGVASGTDALVLSLASLGIKPKDEVITTPFTFIATAEAIHRVGAKPVFCDIDASTFCLDPAKIKQCINSRTKAIIPVHLFGCPCQIDAISSIAKSHNLKIVEDCAQSFGSEYHGKKVGSFGDCGCLSFFPGKTLGAYGDGGMVVTDDETIAENLRILRNHGSSEKYYYRWHGYNSRLDTLQAAVLSIKLNYIDGWIKKRIECAQYYSSLLRNVPGIAVPEISPSIKHSFNYYTIRIKGKRDKVQQYLLQQGIACAVYYPLNLHLQECFKDLGHKDGDFPVAECAQREVLSLPLYPELTTTQIDYIVRCITQAL